MCPLKVFKIKKYKEIWVSDEMLEMIIEKDAALRKAKRTKNDHAWVIARRLRNNCLSKIRKAKSDFIKNEINENMSDSKKFWKQIKEIIPNSGTFQNKIILNDENTGQLIEENNTADYINDFFTNVGPKLARNLHMPWEYKGKVADRHLSDIIVNTEEITKFVKEIEISKSSSIENLSSKVLKDAFLSNIEKLKYLY